MLLILGIIIGILLSIVSTLGTYFLSQRTNLRTRFRQVESALKKKGELIEPEDEDIEEWVENLKKE